MELSEQVMAWHEGYQEAQKKLEAGEKPDPHGTPMTPYERGWDFRIYLWERDGK